MKVLWPGRIATNTHLLTYPLFGQAGRARRRLTACQSSGVERSEKSTADDCRRRRAMPVQRGPIEILVISSQLTSNFRVVSTPGHLRTRLSSVACKHQS